jgi:peroxiredoxin
MRHPNVPESLDGWCILHRMFRFDRRRWDALDGGRQQTIAAEAAALFTTFASDRDTDCGLAQLLGDKGDFMLTFYARSFDALGIAQARTDKLALRDYLAPLSSYVSILELGLYGDTGKIHADLNDRGLKIHSPEWNAAFDAALADVARDPRNAPRLTARIPRRRYVCFYPMNKKRDGADNWYNLPFAERAQMMAEHGKIGRSYHGLVSQVISGSIGFDDWEWGVDLFANDPLVFKKLIYEMRFDHVSAVYALFGQFYVGVRVPAAGLEKLLNGELPK